MVKQKPRIINFAIVIWIIIGILLSAITIYSIYLELDYQNELRDTGEMTSELESYRTVFLIKSTVFRLIPIAIAFIIVFGTYMSKKWAWLLSMMLSFYLLLVYLLGIVNDIGNSVIVGLTDYPFFNLTIAALSPIIILLVMLSMFLYLKKPIKNYLDYS